jgi:hypothetical protein
MEMSSQIAWKLVPLRHFSTLKVVPLIEVLLYDILGNLMMIYQSLLEPGLTHRTKPIGTF